MWFLYRPDAANVWKNEEVNRRYSRYKGILDGKKTARYLITKKIPINISLNNPITELWNEHEKCSREFEEIIKKIDSEKISFESLETPENSFLDLKEKIAHLIIKNCHLCERRCLVNRTEGKKGVCKLNNHTYISSSFLHTGEESILVPSGTIFFMGCTFKCVFCQNHDISQEWCHGDKITGGVEVTSKKIAMIAEDLWKEGGKNINLVGGDPTPNLHTIISSLKYFNKNITMLWNSNMYQSLEATKLLLELVDFWLPDFKFWMNDFAKSISDVKNYKEIITRNIKMAYDSGSGELLIRHLIMPGRVELDTFPILEWCSKEIPKAMVNLMDQYHPDYLVTRKPIELHEINRRITSSEWQKATEKADSLGIFWEPVS